ncbi:hypothetical protein AX774_g153 [Zancudomyces culisetae]|uniref:DUF7082 domain-containing protein n=1 Tax=Zancudomyces culisetae TaxID=1213189 RepID=A0A1R1PZ70_ZANCU|nr:hypothetical protein AX774_g153 [Zancudomyces culisetae]|eukprot:OMH86262.1 hypothetical protein AX774_g153 [Zancudomyces culisetae]
MLLSSHAFDKNQDNNTQKQNTLDRFNCIDDKSNSKGNINANQLRAWDNRQPPVNYGNSSVELNLNTIFNQHQKILSSIDLINQNETIKIIQNSNGEDVLNNIKYNDGFMIPNHEINTEKTILNFSDTQRAFDIGDYGKNNIENNNRYHYLPTMEMDGINKHGYEGNLSRGVNPNMNMGINMDMNPNMSMNMHSHVNTSMNTGMNPNMNSNMNPNINANINGSFNVNNRSNIHQIIYQNIMTRQLGKGTDSFSKNPNSTLIPKEQPINYTNILHPVPLNSGNYGGYGNLQVNSLRPVGVSTSLGGDLQNSSLLNKANLVFEGDLDSILNNWTNDEKNCGRRLVQFWKRNDKCNIICTFKPINAYERTPNSIVVSCIYWENKKDYFITSVDCIHLLESLISVRFTVEEKNRIRRNLEGFRPLTASKCKSDSADFFKLIMSFPNPKPRNIEKDVKVFRWKSLSYALKKIIGKYTSSSSSHRANGLLGSSFESKKHESGQGTRLIPVPKNGANSTNQYANKQKIKPKSMNYVYEDALLGVSYGGAESSGCNKSLEALMNSQRGVKSKATDFPLNTLLGHTPLIDQANAPKFDKSLSSNPQFTPSIGNQGNVAKQTTSLDSINKSTTFGGHDEKTLFIDHANGNSASNLFNENIKKITTSNSKILDFHMPLNSIPEFYSQPCDNPGKIKNNDDINFAVYDTILNNCNYNNEINIDGLTTYSGGEEHESQTNSLQLPMGSELYNKSDLFINSLNFSLTNSSDNTLQVSPTETIEPIDHSTSGAVMQNPYLFTKDNDSHLFNQETQLYENEVNISAIMENTNTTKNMISTLNAYDANNSEFKLKNHDLSLNEPSNSIKLDKCMNNDFNIPQQVKILYKGIV